MDEAKLAAARREYAKTIMSAANLDDDRLQAAFTEVRREDFLGPGPWQLFSFPGGYRETPDDDPIHLCQNIPVGIIPERGLNNGHPQFLAFLIHLGRLQDGDHVVHIGAGVGYYTAIMARLVGRGGAVTAIECEPGLAARAARNLSTFSNVRVIEGDGFCIPLDSADAIYVNAGAAKPADTWLDAMKDGGRLILPLTVTFTTDQGHSMTSGAIFRIERFGDDYSARWISATAIYPCAGARDPQSEAALVSAFKDGGWEKVIRLHRTRDIPDDQCWVRGDGWSLGYH